MANEIQAVASLSISKNSVVASGSASVVATLAGNNYTTLTQTATTSPAALSVGGLTTYGGWFHVKNIGTGTDVVTVYVEAAGTNIIGTLAIGESMLWKPAAAPGVKVTTGTTVDVAITCTEP